MACVLKRRGKWVADYLSSDGKRRSITCETRKEAEAVLAAVSGSIRRGDYVARTDRTLSAVYENWFRLCVRGTDNKRGRPCSPGSAAFYAGTWRRYLLESFGAHGLRTIDSESVLEWKEALARKVGPRSVLAAMQLMDVLFKHARRFNWISSNPCESLYRPKYKGKVRALTSGELAALMEHADTVTWRLIRTAACTGLRASELSGVRFSDIDFTKGVIVVTRQLQDGVELPLKTERSRRRVPLPANLLREFGEDPRRSEGGLLFTSPDGAALNLSNFHRRIWRPLLKAAGIQMQTVDGKVTFHSLRHSAATAAIQSGQTVATVAGLLGHASPQTTLNTYVDQWASMQEQSAEDITEALFPGSGNKADAGKVS
jgi:integrase